MFEYDPYIKFLKYTKLNITNAGFSINVNTDNISTSSCGYGSVTDQVVVFYAGALDNSTEPSYLASAFSPSPVPNPEIFTKSVSKFSNAVNL